MTDDTKAITSPRTVPMKVLCLGYGRTGTTSLRRALLTLGYVHTYHTEDAAFSNPQDCRMWLQWLRAKHDGVGRVPGRQEFDQILGHCQAVCDMPAAYFVEELLQAYPEAKVILTVRDVDEWHKSVENTLEAMDSSYLSAIFGFFASVLLMPNRWNRHMFQQLRKVLYNNDFQKHGRDGFKAHYDLVRSLVLADNLLEYHVSMGWEPLCKFLDKPVPTEGTPFMNKTADSKARHKRIHLKAAQAQTKRLLDICSYIALGYYVFQASQRCF